jgi:hypothetical protein
MITEPGWPSPWAQEFIRSQKARERRPVQGSPTQFLTEHPREHLEAGPAEML